MHTRESYEHRENLSYSHNSNQIIVMVRTFFKLSSEENQIVFNI